MQAGPLRLPLFERLLVERLFASLRLPTARAPRAFMRSALKRFAEGAEVSAVVEGSGLSHRHFLARFREAVGLTPKVHCRVVRFGRAVALLHAAGPGAVPRARRALVDADAAVVLSESPDALEASALVLSSNVPRRVFFDCDTALTASRMSRGESIPWIGDARLEGFDLILTSTGGSTVDVLRESLGARRVVSFARSSSPKTAWTCWPRWRWMTRPWRNSPSPPARASTRSTPSATAPGSSPHSSSAAPPSTSWARAQGREDAWSDGTVRIAPGHSRHRG